MTDILGPASALNAVTARPSDGRNWLAADTFFRDCSSPASQDGTQLAAAWLNQVTGVLRALARVNGLKADGVTPVVAYDQSDAMPLNGIAQLVQRGQLNFAADKGTADAMVATPGTPVAEYLAGMRFVVRKNPAVGANATTAPKIDFGLGQLTVTSNDGSALGTGDLKAGAIFAVVLDGAGNARLEALVKPSDVGALAARTYYVNAATGSDSNTGLTAALAFATIARAVGLATAVNTAGFNVTILVADYVGGTYAAFSLPKINGGGTISIIGNLVTPANVSVSDPAGGSAVSSGISVGTYVLAGMKLSSTKANGLSANGRGTNVQIVDIEFGACALAQISAPGATVSFLGTTDGYANPFIKLSGGAANFIQGLEGTVVDSHGPALVITNSPAYTAFIAASGYSDILFQWSSITGGGTVTGQKYVVYDSKIDTGGYGDSIIPGNVQGLKASGGQEWDGRCLLSVPGGTGATLTLAPLDGNIVIVDGVPSALPSGGVSAANTNLAALTAYYAYLTAPTPGTFALELSATAYAADANGRKIKTGDPTRRLVGIVATNASGQFSDIPAFRGVANYFNRRQRMLQGPSMAGASVSQGGSVTNQTGFPAYVVVFADDGIDAGVFGSAAPATSGAVASITTVIDNVATGSVSGWTAAGASYSAPVAARATVSVAEGLHVITPGTTVNSGNMAVTVAVFGSARG